MIDRSLQAQVELCVFIDIANKKKLSLSFRDDALRRRSLSCVDIDLTRASIENAVARATRMRLAPLAERLQRLLSHGTAAQQVGFVLGSAPTYYFPEDIERMAQSGPLVDHPFTMHGFAWVRCRPLNAKEQICEEYHNRICVILEQA